MKKKIVLLGLSMTLMASLVGCGKDKADKTTETTTATEVVTEATTTATEADFEETSEAQLIKDATDTDAKECSLEDGTYIAYFKTDSTMFHVNEANEDKGILTVKDGKMTIHIALTSKSIVNLYYGLAEDAQKEGAELLEPTVEVVTYSDGLTDEVNSFDVPVPYLDDEFDVALIGKKGVWYDHKVSVSNPVKQDEDAMEELADGEYTIAVVLNGGSGKAGVTSPTKLCVEDGVVFAYIEMSSENYDYMLIGEEKYLPINESGNSMFKIPVSTFDEMPIIADTTAMSTPHEIEYTLCFDKSTIVKVENNEE